MVVNGNYILPVKWPKLEIIPSYSWVTLSNGEKSCSDKGKEYDVYQSKIILQDTYNNIVPIYELFKYTNTSLTFSQSSNEFIFGPHIDHSLITNINSISCSELERTSFTGYSFYCTVAPSTQPIINNSISSVFSNVTRVVEETSKQESFSGVFHQRLDINSFEIKSSQFTPTLFSINLLCTLQESQQILKYIFNTARASRISMPNFPGYIYPFGQARGTYPLYCKITKTNVERYNATMWSIYIEFSYSS